MIKLTLSYRLVTPLNPAFEQERNNPQGKREKLSVITTTVLSLPK